MSALATICAGSTLILGKKFSRSRFFADIAAHGINVVTIPNSPPRHHKIVLDTAHKSEPATPDGRLIVEARGSGPVRYLVADYDTSGGLRGYCRFAADEVAAGYVLTCQSVPVGEGVAVDYDA